MTPPPPRRQLLSPHAGMFLVVLFWAGNFTAAKLSFEEMDPAVFTAIRFTFASVVLWGIVRATEGRVKLPPRLLWPLIVMGVIGNTLYQICFMEGLNHTTATKSSLILAGMPAVVILAAGALRIERVTSLQRWAVLLATVGVVVVIMGRGRSIDKGVATGDLLLLGAVFTWAAYTLLMRRWKVQLSALNFTAWTLYTGTPGLVLYAIPALRHTDWQRITIVGWSGIAYSALLSLVAAYALWNRGIATLGAARTVVYNTIVPLVATVIAMVALHERPGLIHVIGGCFIIAGVALTARKAPAEK